MLFLLLVMDYIQISLESLKEIVQQAEKDFGGNNGTVFFRSSKHSACWGLRENYYKSSLTTTPLEIQKGVYYSHQTEYSQLVTEGTMKPLPSK